MRGLYAGTVPSLAAQVAENSILFAAYGLCQKMVAHTTNTEVAKLSTLGKVQKKDNYRSIKYDHIT